MPPGEGRPLKNNIQRPSLVGRLLWTTSCEPWLCVSSSAVENVDRQTSESDWFHVPSFPTATN